MANENGRYVGPRELHDAIIVRAERDGAVARVELVSAEQRPITLEFQGVTQFLTRGKVASHMIYALWQTEEADGSRRFLFVPWEDDVEPRLVIVADGFRESAG
jgi:hypothetical protein